MHCFHFMVLFKPMLNFVCMVDSHGMHLDVYEPISFKLYMMMDTTKVSILIPLSKTLAFTQGAILLL